MGSIEAGASRRWVRLDGGLGHGRSGRVAHRVMMMQRRRLRRSWASQVPIGLHMVRSPVTINSSHGSAAYTCSRLVRRVIEKRPDIVHEEGIKLLCNFLLVCKLESTFEWDPDFG